MKELTSHEKLRGKCDYCKHKKYIGIYGKPCVTPEPCLHPEKNNWELETKNVKTEKPWSKYSDGFKETYYY